MKIALAQINTTVGALKANTQKILAALEQAGQAGAHLLLLPELSISGYPPLDLLDEPAFIDKNLDCLRQIAEASRQWPELSVLVGYIARNHTRQGRKLHNAAAVIQDGAVTSSHFKSLLPTYDVFDEDRYFEPAAHVHPVQIGSWRCGVTICEDIWNDSDFWSRQLYLKDPIAELHAQGINLLLNISASPFHVGKPQLRQEMLQALCQKYGMPAIYLNQVGANDSLIFDGHSCIVNAWGELVWRSQGFTEELAIIELESLLQPDFKPTLPWPSDMALLEEALCLGIKDYLGKSGFGSAVIGLSGGIDSALTAALAVKALGPEKVLGVAMPSAYSSQGSLDDAQGLATNLGIAFETIAIAPIFDQLRQSLKPIFGERAEDVTEENLQARIRGNLLMALSNKLGHLLLTTGNKSEMAVGYCTLYGDMCGGLGVIADLPKTWVYQLAAYINREGEVIPRSTLEKAPSAELRPNQKDQDSLPPYDILDGILQAYIEQHRSAAEIIALGYASETVHWVIQRINQNEYKRRQAPPGLKVTRKAFGQGRRYPIARGYD